ncbi:MAG TPA: hypothetical protein ACYCDB_01385 [Candidatus Azoamicus sp.]
MIKISINTFPDDIEYIIINAKGEIENEDNTFNLMLFFRVFDIVFFINSFDNKFNIQYSNNSNSVAVLFGISYTKINSIKEKNVEAEAFVYAYNSMLIMLDIIRYTLFSKSKDCLYLNLENKYSI